MKIREILSTPELRLRNIEKYVLSVYLKSIEVDEFIENNEDKVKHKKWTNVKNVGKKQMKLPYAKNVIWKKVRNIIKILKNL